MQEVGLLLTFRLHLSYVYVSWSVCEVGENKLEKLGEMIRRVRPSGHYMYRQFNIQKFYVLPTQCIYVFCVDLRTNSHYFPIQH